jgi:hypothetical protein
MKPRKPWTAIECKKLAAMWPNRDLSVVDIASALGREPKVVAAKAHYMHLGPRRRPGEPERPFAIPVRFRDYYRAEAEKRGMRMRDLCLLILDIVAERRMVSVILAEGDSGR